MWGGASHQMRGAVWPFEPLPRLHITGFQKPQYSCGTQIVAKGQIIRSTQGNGESRNRNTEICPNSFFKVYFLRGAHIWQCRGASGFELGGHPQWCSRDGIQASCMQSKCSAHRALPVSDKNQVGSMRRNFLTQASTKGLHANGEVFK